MGPVFQLRGLDIAILDGYKKVIECFAERDDIDEYTKIMFLSSYKNGERVPKLQNYYRIR